MEYINKETGVAVDSIDDVMALGCATYEDCGPCPLDELCDKKELLSCDTALEMFPDEVCSVFGFVPIEDDASTTAEDPATSADMVNRPSHYTMGGIECIDAIEAAIGHHEDPVEAFLTGQVMKYIWRWPHKAKPLEDLKKTKWYLDRLIAHREKKEDRNGQ